MVEYKSNNSKKTGIKVSDRALDQELRGHIFDDAPIAIFEIDLISLKLKWLNKRVSQLMGYSKNELLAINIQELLTENSNKIFRERIVNALQSHETHFNVEVQVKKRNGSPLWGLFSSKVIFTNGKPLSLLVFAQDTTEHKKTEQRLAEKQLELARILDSSPSIVFYKNKAGIIIEANRAFAEAIKVNKKDIVGKTVFDLYSSEIAQQMTNDDRIVMETKQPKLGIIEPYESPTGLRWIRTDKIPILGENGEVTGIVGFSEEITERKKAEDALLESEAKYEQLVNRLPEMVFEINTEGKIVFANSRVTEILGYTKEELENNFSANKLVAPEDVERSKRNMKIIFSGRMRHSNEYLFVKKDGTKFPVLLNSVPIIKDNKILGARGLVIDISERKNLEKKMAENERIVTIGQIARMVGHDIRNPLQAIVCELFLAQKDIAKAPESKHKFEAWKSLSFVQTQIDYINKIVSDLQDYARPLKPELSETELTDLIHNILETIIFPSNVRLLVETDGALHCRTDQIFIRRTLTNLVNNAIQSMPDGGDLKITAAKKGDKFSIAVADTGMGIPEEVKAKLFTPMVTTKSEGQGLGLAVVKRLVEALNGSIGFESEEGKGTRFIIELPTH
jgi:PAS domain S-box-containing protein